MSAAWRTVRVFISSTFRDMHAERDHLVRFVFPRLRERLPSRRMPLVDVDLRWGVTSEQDAPEVCRETITECRALSASGDEPLRLWDLEAGGTKSTSIGHAAALNSLAVSSDGRRVVSGSVDRTLKVWDLRAGHELRTLAGNSSQIMAVAITPDAHRIVSGDYDGTLELWAMESGREVASAKGHVFYLKTVAVSPDGRLLRLILPEDPG